MNGRGFLTMGLIAVAAVMVDGSRVFATSEHKCKLAPEKLLPKYIGTASEEVREAYPFASPIGTLFATFRVTAGVGHKGTQAMRLVASRIIRPRKNSYSSG